MNLKFSIITATYNSSSSIRNTIESVLRQSYENYEHIFIDGASKDNTIEIIKELTKSTKEKVKIISEPDKGIYDALNKGLEHSSGDVIAFMHADDFYADKLVLEKVAETFDLENTDSVYGDLEYVSKDNIQNVVRYWNSGNFEYSNLKKGWMPPHPSFFVKKYIYEKHGRFDLSYKIAGDYDFMMRVLFKEKITTAYLRKVCVKMRVGGESNKSVGNIIRKSKEDLRAMKNNELGGILSLISKNVRKLPQFFRKKNT